MTPVGRQRLDAAFARDVRWSSSTDVSRPSPNAPLSSSHTRSRSAFEASRASRRASACARVASRRRSASSRAHTPEAAVRLVDRGSDQSDGCTCARAPDRGVAISTETNVGGLNLGRGLNLSHASPVTSGSGNRQSLSISFDRAVTGLSLWITDIDSTRNGSGTNRDPYVGWWDRVALGGTFDQSRDPLVLGVGTEAAPWYYNDLDTNIGNEAVGARVQVTCPGTIAAGATVTLQYWSTQSGGNQRIFLSDMNWTSRGC